MRLIDLILLLNLFVMFVGNYLMTEMLNLLYSLGVTLVHTKKSSQLHIPWLAYQRRELKKKLVWFLYFGAVVHRIHVRIRYKIIFIIIWIFLNYRVEVKVTEYIKKTDRNSFNWFSWFAMVMKYKLFLLNMRQTTHDVVIFLFFILNMFYLLKYIIHIYLKLYFYRKIINVSKTASTTTSWLYRTDRGDWKMH